MSKFNTTVRVKLADDYKRFHVTSIKATTTVSREVSIDLYEDVENMSYLLTIDNETYDQDVIDQETDFIRTVHCGITLTVDQLPHIITLLQYEYDRFQEYLTSKPSSGEANDTKE